MDAWQSFPFGLALAFLWAVAMLRGQATYWLARTVTEQALRRTRPRQGWRAAVHRWLSGDAMDRGRGTVQRYGVAAVPVCYLTVGVQTVVLASAGVVRMPWPRFTLAQAVGALAWATIYATVGFAVWAAFFEAALRGGPGLVLLLLAVAAVVGAATVGAHRRRRRRRSATMEACVPSSPSPLPGRSSSRSRTSSPLAATPSPRAASGAGPAPSTST